MGRVVWRIVGMVALGIGGLVVALALTLGALAFAGDGLDGGTPSTGLTRPGRPTASPIRDEPSRTSSPTRSPTRSVSPSDDGSDDDGGPDDDGGSDDGSSGHGSGDDSSGHGSGDDDHSNDDD